MRGKLVKTSLIVAVLSSLVIPPALLGPTSSQVSAADPPELTEILRPNAPGDQCSIVSQIGEPCPNHYLNVDDVTPDEDATVVRELWPYTSTHTDLYNIEDTSIGRGAINKVTVYARCRRQSGYAYAIDFWVVLKTHGTVYSQKFSYLGTSYTNLSHSWTNNPFTGHPWTWTEINDLQIGVTLQSYWGVGWASSGYSTQVYAAVDYTPPFAADFEWSPEDPAPDEEITFASTSYDPQGLIVSYGWDFGDNTTGAGENVTHAFQNAGDYVVTLTVSDNVGATDNISKTVSVRPWSFAIITDLHIGREIEDYDGSGWNDSGAGQEDIPSVAYLRQAVSIINSNKQKYNIKFVAILGDLSESAELSQLNKVIEILNGLEIPWVPLIGNHDVWPYYGANPDIIDPYAEMAPEVGPDDAGTDVYFQDRFQPQYLVLANILDNWEKAGIPVWNPEVDPTHNSYFQNFAFDYNGYHFIGLDFNARDNALWPFKGVAAEGDLHTFADGTWDWFTDHLQQYLAAHQESEENIILLAHHPFNTGIVSFSGFSQGELIIMYDFLGDYLTNIYAEFAGHTHQNRDRWWFPPGMTSAMRVIETEANYEDTLVRVVQIASVGEIDYSKFLPENGMTIKAFSPVDLVITDPDNLTISKESNEIPGATYMEIHLDGDGILDDLIRISERKIGEYTIEVIPEAGVDPADTYTIEVSTMEDSFGYVPVIVADNVTIEAIPTEPYLYNSAEREPTQLTYTGDLSGVNTASANLSAVLVDESGIPLPEKTIIFEIGDQSASAVTDENGLVSTTLTLEQAAGRYYFVDAYFGGDEDYLPAFDSNPFEIKIPATIDFDPDTLNLKGQGEWITAYIELPTGWDVADIDLSTVLLNGVLPAISDPQYGFVTDPASYITDNDGDGILERMVKFDREAVKQLVNVEEDLEEVPGGLQGEIQLTISGTVAGMDFEGGSIIVVILKGK